MRANVLLLSSVLVVGLLTGGCRDGGPGGPERDAGVADGGNKSDAGGEDAGQEDGGGMAPACDVARQRGCDAGELCLREVLEDGGQGERCFPGECDPVARDCPAGSKCTYVRQEAVTSRRCVPEGTVPEGGACQSTATPGGDFHDTCQAGLYCTDQPAPDGGLTFTCERFCHASEQCTAPRDCTEVLRFTGSDELPRVCGEAASVCDPLARDCESPLGCYPSPGSGSVCVTAGAMEDGAACTYSNDCRPGSACVKDGAGRACRRLCRSPSGEPGCASGRCEPLRDFAGVGACMP